MKIFGGILIVLALLVIVLTVASGVVDIIQRRGADVYQPISFNEVYEGLGIGLSLLVIGCVVYGIGRAVQELTLIRKLLQRPRL